MGFSRPRYWCGSPFPSPGYLPNPGIEPRSPILQVDSLSAEPQGKSKGTGVGSLSLLQWTFTTKDSNQGLLHCRQILYQLSYQRNPIEIGCTYIESNYMNHYSLLLSCLFAHSYPTLCDTMDCSSPCFSVHGISHARIPEWVAISSSRGSSWPRDWTHVSCISRQILYPWATGKAHQDYQQ